RNRKLLGMAMVKLNKKASMGTAVFSAVSLKLCCWEPLILTGVTGIGGSSVYFSWLIALIPCMLAIEDESSVIFQLDPETGKIPAKQKMDRRLKEVFVILNTFFLLKKMNTLIK
ncbi:MAG: hypothetical protein WDZ80_03570, partial [Candidatus Paceibacterota bacterium]